MNLPPPLMLAAVFAAALAIAGAAWMAGAMR